jgi:putative DNA primase/helicase
MGRPTELVLAHPRIAPSLRRSGRGHLARCPAHEDTTPSLSINEGRDGRVLLHCFGGCSIEAVCLALGLSQKALFPDGGVSPSGHSVTPQPAKARSEVASYPYCDDEGTILRERVRYEPKGFAWRHQNSRGQWIPGFGNGPRALYRLPELHEARERGLFVFIVEGEKDAEALVHLGYVATTAGSAEDWRPEFNKELAGCHLIVLPDNDAAGNKLIGNVLAGQSERSPLSCPKSVRIVQLSSQPKADVSTWIAAQRQSGKSDDDIRAEIEKLLVLLRGSEMPAVAELRRLEETGE